jgi:hypothetical protein
MSAAMRDVDLMLMMKDKLKSRGMDRRGTGRPRERP